MQQSSGWGSIQIGALWGIPRRGLSQGTAWFATVKQAAEVSTKKAHIRWWSA